MICLSGAATKTGNMNIKLYKETLAAWNNEENDDSIEGITES